MKFVFTVILILGCSIGICQASKWSIRYKASFFSNLAGQYVNLGRIVPPSHETKGRLYLPFTFSDSFYVNKTSTDLERLASCYTHFICDFVLTDSLYYYDFIRIIFVKGKDSKPLYERDIRIGDSSYNPLTNYAQRLQSLLAILPFECQTETSGDTLKYHIPAENQLTLENFAYWKVFAEFLLVITSDYVLKRDYSVYKSLLVSFEDKENDNCFYDCYNFRSRKFVSIYKQISKLQDK